MVASHQIASHCECRWLRPDERTDGLWTCLMCGKMFDVIGIRQRMLDGEDVNEVIVETAAQGD